jgi:uncharacterized protein
MKEDPMDVYKTHGAFSWSELSTTDPAAAVKFYSQLFGWATQDMDMGSGTYHVAKLGDTSVAGIMGMPPGSPPMPPNWGCYVTVSNVEEVLAKCSALGGKTLMPPMDVPGVGRMAVLQDPQGAILSVMAYSS